LEATDAAEAADLEATEAADAADLDATDDAEEPDTEAPLAYPEAIEDAELEALDP